MKTAFLTLFWIIITLGVIIPIIKWYINKKFYLKPHTFWSSFEVWYYLTWTIIGLFLFYSTYCSWGQQEMGPPLLIRSVAILGIGLGVIRLYKQFTYKPNDELLNLLKNRK